MKKIDNLVRQNIRNLQPYSSARDEFQGTASVYLDANENPFGTLNRYPDSYQKQLKTNWSSIKNIPTENIFVGNGSDEAIDLLFRIFCNPGKDKALCFTPGYGMYAVSAAINDTTLIEVPLNQDFQIDMDLVTPYLNDEHLKLLFICSPNNPTGNVMDRNTIQTLLEQFKGIVVIDEAYIDFSATGSWAKELEKYPHLVVLQTMSKAYGLAAARIGFALASTSVIAYLNKVKPPYNVSALNQQAALEVLSKYDQYQNQIAALTNERKRVAQSLSSNPIIQKIWPSDANFLLLQLEDAEAWYDKLCRQNIIVRNRSKQVPDTLRITIGTTEENNTLLNALQP